jgi:hypothetical protein
MPLRYLLDEHLRGPLWQAIHRHNASGRLPLDAERVGDPADLPLGSDDPTILLWAERAGRIVLSLDKTTMPGHLAEHLRAGHHCPGLFILDATSDTATLLDYLELAAHAGDPAAYHDQIWFVP